MRSIQSQEAFILSGGSLTVSNAFYVDRNFILGGGTLARATVRTGTNGFGVLIGREFLDGGSGGLVNLDGVTFDSRVLVRSAATLAVTNGLVVNEKLTLGSTNYNADYGRLEFFGDQTLDGIGEINLDYGIASPNWLGANYLRAALQNTILTIGPGIRIRGRAGVIGGQFTGTINRGLITSDVPGGLLYTSGTFTNAGAIRTEGGTLETFGSFMSEGGSIEVFSGALRLGGSLRTSGLNLPEFHEGFQFGARPGRPFRDASVPLHYVVLRRTHRAHKC